MTEDLTPLPARKELQRGLNALRLEVDGSIVNSLQTLVDNAIAEARRALPSGGDAEVAKAAKRYALANVRYRISQIDDANFLDIAKEFDAAHRALLEACEPADAALSAPTREPR